MIRAESFAQTRLPGGVLRSGESGDVPFGDVRLHDPVFNRRGHSIQHRFLVELLARTRWAGWSRRSPAA
jgi:hypothetical protein